MTTPRRPRPGSEGVTVVRPMPPPPRRREPEAADTTRWTRIAPDASANSDDDADAGTTTVRRGPPPPPGAASSAATLERTTGAGAALRLVPSEPPPAPAPRPRAPTPAPIAVRSDALGLRRLASATRRISLQRTVDDVGRAAAALAPAVVDGHRARFLFVDAGRGAMWQPGSDDELPVSGLAGAAVTGGPVIVDRGADDPRYQRAVDDPAGNGDERLAAMPIADADAEVHAVLIVARPPSAPPFDAADRELLAALAARIATVIDAFALEARADELEPPPVSPFRPEAIAAHDQRQDEGAVLRLAPRWSRVSYWLVVAFAAVAVGYLSLARIDDHAEGPAVVVAEDRTPVPLRVAATVRDVLVGPGDTVGAGQAVARLDDASQRADLIAVEAELEQRLIDRLQRPGDEVAASALAQLVTSRDRVRAELDQRTVRAPIAGVVTDVRIRPGQPVAAGQEAMAIVDGDPRVGVIALVPAGLAPRIRPGMALRLQLAGHPGTYETLTVTAVASDATGPAGAAQLLGAELADAIPLGGAMVVVRGHSDRHDFAAGHDRLPYRHGMAGTAAIRIRSQRLITALIPGLDEVFGHDD